MTSRAAVLLGLALVLIVAAMRIVSSYDESSRVGWALMAAGLVVLGIGIGSGTGGDPGRGRRIQDLRFRSDSEVDVSDPQIPRQGKEWSPFDER